MSRTLNTPFSRMFSGTPSHHDTINLESLLRRKAPPQSPEGTEGPEFWFFIFVFSSNHWIQGTKVLPWTAGGLPNVSRLASTKHLIIHMIGLWLSCLGAWHALHQYLRNSPCQVQQETVAHLACSSQSASELLASSRDCSCALLFPSGWNHEVWIDLDGFTCAFYIYTKAIIILKVRQNPGVL